MFVLWNDSSQRHETMLNSSVSVSNQKIVYRSDVHYLVAWCNPSDAGGRLGDKFESIAQCFVAVGLLRDLVANPIRANCVLNALLMAARMRL